MLSVSEAQAIVLEHAAALPAVTTKLSASALGLVLGEDIVSDLDVPPYDKSMMDGYALRMADVRDGRATLQVVEEIMAGQTPRKTLAAGQAARIMTGAPIPAGADVVVMIERTQLSDDGRVTINDASLAAGRNVMPRGREMRGGDRVLQAGAVLRPQEFGLLATVGRTSVLAHAAPGVGVLPTGDEIVDPTQLPGPSQIRNSNGPMLLAQVGRAGGVAHDLGIARDRLDSLGPLIREGLRLPILLLSGGVSAGKLDLVPGVLEELGVKAHFHKVSMKPGKPVLFGTASAGDTGMNHLVFGLPGNPVSTYVCFELFVRPAIRRLAGHGDPAPRMVQAQLVEDFAYKTDRPTYHPAQLEANDRGWTVRPRPWFGSPDLRTVTQTNAFALLPEGDHQHRAGQTVPVLVCE